MRLFSLKWFLCAAFTCLLPTSFAWAQFSFGFNVDTNLIDTTTNTSTGTITPTQQTQLGAALTNSANFWQQFVVGFRPGVTPSLTGINIDVAFENFPDANGVPNGPNGTLASAQPLDGGLISSGGFNFATNFSATNPNPPTALIGSLTIDFADLNLLGTPLFENVLNHELAHALGFGNDLFGLGNLYDAESGQYTGVEGLAAYQAEFDPSATFVPIELDGGPGTRNGHLNEVASFGALEDVIPDPNGQGLIPDPNGENDPGDLMGAPTVLTPGATFGLSQDDALLTGRISDSPDTFLSDTTVAIFRDLGFEVRLPSEVRASEAVPEPSGLLFLGGLACIAALGRRKI